MRTGPLVAAIAAIAAPAASAQAPVPTLWAEIGAEARATVAAETPAAALPFDPAKPVGTPGRAPIVAVHYFPPFPLSLDNGLAGRDYYARNYLRAAGEGGKFAAQRGFLRERPLPVPPGAPTHYDGRNLAIEVARASRIGIDAFGVDLLSIAGSQWPAATQLLEAARAVDPRFRIFPEPDMAGLSKLSVRGMADALEPFARHPSGLKLADGRLLVMPLAPNRMPPRYWQDLIAEMKRRGAPVAVVPDFIGFENSDQHRSYAWGITIWGTRDTKAGDRARATQIAVAKAGVPNWFAPVAPQDYRPKDGLINEARNSEAYRNQWMAAIDGRAAGVHLITWNDYSESSQIAPSSVSQFVWYDLTAYYTAWAKAGAPPRIVRDALYPVYRRQIVDLSAGSRGPAQTVVGATPLSNDVEVVALLKAPGRLTITLGGRTVSRDVGAGLQTLRMPAAPGTPSFRLTRAGKTAAAITGPWPIEARPARHDATYVGGSSLRRRVDVPGYQGDGN
ncbi:endo-1,3-alpha-glucanase family glycosylhydrolase [uncultured Sphingomonas sp.]|uniref:endo-1,3-alpha-glucanase family glycosylhydrolase n=1 Tax=uncultured Sphingomonas sp. TaxID=158754 RepID=UPI0025D1B5FA|nr:endo-1,3-alpha-glucanase family glycosylhydrolase [uncultured Sphingomonas sp.]